MLNEQLVSLVDKMEWLWMDATKVTSGFVGEHYFEEKFLKPDNLYTYSTGWYHCNLGNTDVPFVFFLGNNMTELDREILSKFGNERYFCQVYFNNGLHFWYHGKISQYFNQGHHFNEEDFINELGLTKLQDKIVAPEKSKNRTEFVSYLKFFLNERIFNKVFLDRYFCNGFLVQYFRKVIDFDFIIKNSKNEYIIADVKFKYPIHYIFKDRNYRYFGINVAPGKLYRELSKSFKIYNFNFIKPESDTNNLVDFISKGHLQQMYYSKLNVGFIREDNIFPRNARNVNDNQTGTDYSGKKQTPYYRFPISEYTCKNLTDNKIKLPF